MIQRISGPGGGFQWHKFHKGVMLVAYGHPRRIWFGHFRYNDKQYDLPGSFGRLSDLERDGKKMINKVMKEG